MAEMGNGYGSECHLLRYLGRPRVRLDQRILEVVGGSAARWLDFGFDRSRKKWPNAEWKGVDFLPDNEPAKAEWLEFWPQSGNVPNWDAVGRVAFTDHEEWLLVGPRFTSESLTPHAVRYRRAVGTGFAAPSR